MRNAFIIVCVLLSCTAMPSSAWAWGSVGHRLIMQRALDLLPPELKPFFTANRDELVMRIVDPDLWRVAGWEDDPNHFLNLGAPELGPDPFTALPRDYGAALEKFGMDRLKRIGMAPWREAEMFGQLRRAFERMSRQSPYASSDVILFSAAAGHYVQDAHQPLHATNNYDGQLTGQPGLHARFESELIERFVDRLTLSPKAPAPITSPRDAMFDTLLASHRLVPQLLAADRSAATRKGVHDDEYYQKLFIALKPMLERQLSASASATAATIIGAWEQAGRPSVPLKSAGRPRR
jgi:hypothetical protein